MTSAADPAAGHADQADPERGSVAVWLLLIAPSLLAFAGLVLDGGRTISARQDAANLAEQAARTAVDQLSDTSRTGNPTMIASRAAAAAVRRSAMAGLGAEVRELVTVGPPRWRRTPGGLGRCRWR